MPLSPGTKLGPYEIVARLGAGGMGEVYRARDPRLGRDLAIKVLPDSLSRDGDFLARFQAEARAASALNHPNIIIIHDIGEAEGHSFILMELVDGRTVRDLTDAGPLPLKKVLQIAAQAAEGLAAAHARGIVHRDLKPENLMVTKDGVVKILDFGLAKTASLGASAEDRTVSAGIAGPPTGTQPGTVLGTVGYMSPEQASGEPVDYRSDQFSLGTILYETLTGKRAWRRRTPAESLVAIIREEPEPISAAAPGTPTPLRWVLERCLAKDPDDRYASTRDLARDLRYISDHLSDVASAVTAAGIEPPRPRRRALALAGLAAAILAAAAGGLLLGLSRGRAGTAAPLESRYLTYSGFDSEPAASPDGKVIAFTSLRGGTRRIWLKQLADGSEVALTSGVDRAPRFSPDGASVIFTRTESDGRDSLYRVPLLGGEPRRLVENAYNGDVAPDGQRVAFLRDGPDGSQQLFVLSPGSEQGAPVFQSGRQDILCPPRWSPDGRWIVTGTGTEGAAIQRRSLIFLVTGDGKEKRELRPAGGAGSILSTSWSGDAGGLLYAQITPGPLSTHGSVLLQSVRGGTAELLLHSLSLGASVEPLRPGVIVTDVLSLRENLRETILESGPWRDANPRGAWITRGNATDRQPVYSPDGARVLFSSNRDGNEDLWEITLASGAVRRLTDHPASDADPAYTPDGKHIVWSSRRSGTWEIWIAGADGTGAHQLSNDGHDAENPSVTADGQWIYYASYGNDNPGAGIWRIRPDGSGAERAVKGFTAAPMGSPDGRYVLVLETGLTNYARVARTSDGAILPLRVSSGTGDARRTPVYGIGRARWSPDGRTFVFSGMDDQGRVGLYSQDFDGERETSASRRRLLGFDPDAAPDTFAFSPDGKKIVTGFAIQTSDLMIVSGLPATVAPARLK